MAKRQPSMKQRYRDFRLLLFLWLVFMVVSLLSTNLNVVLAMVGVTLGVFGLIKSLGLKCPRCNKGIYILSYPKFCPHCGATLVKDDSR